MPAEHDNGKSRFDTRFVWPLCGNGRRCLSKKRLTTKFPLQTKKANRVNTREHANMSESKETPGVADADATRNNQDDEGGNEAGAAETEAQENQTGGDDGKDGDEGACTLDRSRSSSASTLLLKSGMVLPKCVRKCNDEVYADMRETVRTMMFLISECPDVLRTPGRERWF